MLKSRTVDTGHGHVTFNAEQPTELRQSAQQSRAAGNEWAAQNKESHAAMIGHVLRGGDYYESYIPSGQ